jgi:hypothetical protein
MANPAQYPTLADPAVIGIILQALDAPSDSWLDSICNRYNSTQATETYAAAGNVAPMREWIGEKQIKSLNTFSLTISNKDWESTLRLFERDIRRDKINQLEMKAAELAARAREHEEKLVSSLIDTADDADLGTAYDGQYFFDTDHSVGSSGTINNDITVDISALPTGDTTGTHGSTTAPSVGEAALSVLQGIQALYGFRDDQGEPTNQSARDFTVMVPTSLWAPFSGINTIGDLAGGFKNPLPNAGVNVRVVVNPRLTWTAAFAVFINNANSRPFAIQTEVAPTVSVLGVGSDYHFHNKARLYSVDKTGNVGYQNFLKSCLVTMI